MKRLFFLLSVAPAALAIFSCSGAMDELPCLTCSVPQEIKYSTPVEHGGKIYETIVIGTQVWFQSNLNYEPPDDVDSKCWGDDPANCEKYGRLYNWATAMALSQICNDITCSSQITAKHKGICPSGWHIPNGKEWDTLMVAVGGYLDADRYLKANSGWKDKDNISITYKDAYGFKALPGGRGLPGGSFFHVGSGGYWWSANEDNTDSKKAEILYMTSDTDEPVKWYRDEKSFLFSVRCVKN